MVRESYVLYSSVPQTAHCFDVLHHHCHQLVQLGEGEGAGEILTSNRFLYFFVSIFLAKHQ